MFHVLSAAGLVSGFLFSSSLFTTVHLLAAPCIHLFGSDLKRTQVFYKDSLLTLWLLHFWLASGAFAAPAPVGFRDNNPLASIPDGLAPASPVRESIIYHRLFLGMTQLDVLSPNQGWWCRALFQTVLIHAFHLILISPLSSDFNIVSQYLFT